VARTVNTEVRTVRRDAFIDAAMRLIHSSGYEKMTLQDVLDTTEASRGAFYHYFDSKDALLDSVLWRMTDAVLASVAAVIDDPAVPALEKIDRLFSGIAHWKNQRKELVVGVLDVWYSDVNAIVRERFRSVIAGRMIPVLARIVRQGKDQGTFLVTSPDETARVLWSLIQGAQETAGELLLARQRNAIPFEAVAPALAAYPAAFERILGVPHGSVRLADDETLRLWFERPLRVQGGDR
jgi:AcrR family transcriptional regulator